MTRIEKLAAEICILTPAKPNKYAVCAQVPWDLIHELRAAMQEAGFDLDKARKVLGDARANERRRIGGDT